MSPQQQYAQIHSIPPTLRQISPDRLTITSTDVDETTILEETIVYQYATTRNPGLVFQMRGTIAEVLDELYETVDRLQTQREALRWRLFVEEHRARNTR
jgi:hypothetical protein